MSIKNKIIKGTGFAFFLSLSSFNAFAICDAELLEIEVKHTASDTYDVFAEGSIGLEKNFQADIKTDCPVSLVVSAVDNRLDINGTSAQHLAFLFYAQGGQTSNNQLVMPSVTVDTKTLFAIRFPAKQYSAAGSMSKEMLAQLWNTETQTLITERKFTLDVNVKSTAAVYFSGIDQRVMNVDLGELTTNKKINWLPQLRVISTSPYELSFNSENLGKLQHTSNNSAWIDYQFLVNQEVLELEKGEQKWFSAEMTSYLGQLVGLSMTIGETKNKPAGSYKDTLYISVKPSLILL